MRLLLVEDHVPLADELVAGLKRQGYAVDWLADGRDAVYQGDDQYVAMLDRTTVAGDLVTARHQGAAFDQGVLRAQQAEAEIVFGHGSSK